MLPRMELSKFKTEKATANDVNDSRDVSVSGRSQKAEAEDVSVVGAIIVICILLGIIAALGIYYVIRRSRKNSARNDFDYNDESQIIPTIPKQVTTISVQSKIAKTKTNTTWSTEEIDHRSHNGYYEPEEKHQGGRPRGSRKRYDRILTETSDGTRIPQKDSPTSGRKRFMGKFLPFNLEIGKSRKNKKAMSVPVRPKPAFQDDFHVSTPPGGTPTHVGRSASSDDMAVVEAIGMLHIHITHRHEEEELVVTIKEVSDIDVDNIQTKVTGAISPTLCVTGCIMPGQRRRFKSKDSALVKDAKWNETITLNDLSFSAIGQLALRFRLILRPALGERSIILGSGLAVLQDMEFGSQKDVDITLIKPNFEHCELGDLHLSMCYQPEAKRIVYLVIEAKDLLKTTASGARTQSMVQIDVISGDRKLDRQKTAAVKETDDPVWNHQVAYPIPDDDSQLRGCRFVFTVLQKDVVKGLHTVGQVELGWGSTCEQLEHWQDVIRNPNRPISAWHSLQNPE